MNNENHHSTLNAIIVDDEKNCIANLQHFLTRLCPRIKIIATGSSLNIALAKCTLQKIDIAFLDVELFDDDIFHVLKKIGTTEFKLIFVTAHKEYALQAIKNDALDYILKPLCDEDILSCYERTIKYFSENNALNGFAKKEQYDRITIKHAGDILIINPEDIYYIKGHGFYSELVFINNTIKSVIISKPLHKLEVDYHYPFMFRIHKSYLVNISHITNFSRKNGLYIKMSNEYIIPVAKRRVNDFMSFLNHAG